MEVAGTPQKKLCVRLGHCDSRTILVHMFQVIVYAAGKEKN